VYALHPCTGVCTDHMRAAGQKMLLKWGNVLPYCSIFARSLLRVLREIDSGKCSACRERHGKCRCDVILHRGVYRNGEIQNVATSEPVVADEMKVVARDIEPFEKGRGVESDYGAGGYPCRCTPTDLCSIRERGMASAAQVLPALSSGEMCHAFALRRSCLRW